MSPADQANPLQVLNDARAQLAGATLRVAQLILADPALAAGESITQLARRAETSPATVTRLATTLGFRGYPALRSAIATEYGRGVQAGWEQDIGDEINPGDSPEQVLQVLAGTHARAIRNAVATIDLEAAGRAADRIVAAQRIHIYGEWGDEIPAKELYFRLLRIGLNVWFHDGSRSAGVGARLCGPDDVALAFSRLGADTLGARFITEAGANGAHGIVITGEPDSPVGRAAEIILATGTRQGQSWTDFFGGRASDTLTAGLLWVLVSQRLPDHVHVPTGHQSDTEAFPVTHPPPVDLAPTASSSVRTARTTQR